MSVTEKFPISLLIDYYVIMAKKRKICLEFNYFKLIPKERAEPFHPATV